MRCGVILNVTNVGIAVAVLEPMGACAVQSNAEDVGKSTNVENVARTCQHSGIFRQQQDDRKDELRFCITSDNTVSLSNTYFLSGGEAVNATS